MYRQCLYRFVVVAAVLVASASTALADLQAQVEQALRAAKLGSTKVGLMMVDLDQHEVLASVNAEASLIPASNLKLFTTAAALKTLGPDFTFQTELRLIEASTWNQALGAQEHAPVLLVVGDGDPAFADPKVLEAHGLDVEALLQTWVNAVARTGKTHISQLVVDDRVFDRQWVHPTWPEDQLNKWYCAQVAGLTFYDNCLDIFAQPSGLGLPPTVTIVPESPFLTTENNAVSGKSDAFWISRPMGTNDLTFRGTVRVRMTVPVNITVHDPPIYFARLLADRLQRAGIRVDNIGRPTGSAVLPRGRALHFVRTRLPLVLARCNKDSQNLFAECLIKRTGHQLSGGPGSWDGGALAVQAFLAQTLGDRAAGMRIADGSGMSRENLVTADAMVGLLQAMHADPELAQPYLESLSQGGVDGTLRHRFKKTTGVVRGKSGYIRDVSTLSGYVTIAADPQVPGSRDRTFAFSLLFNDFDKGVHVLHVKKMQDKLVELLDAYAAKNTHRPALQKVN